MPSGATTWLPSEPPSRPRRCISSLAGTAARHGPRPAHGRPAEPRGHVPAPDQLWPIKFDGKGTQSMLRPTGPRTMTSPCCRTRSATGASFWRNPQSAFFTFVFPVVIITIFGGLSATVAGVRTSTACRPSSATCLLSPRSGGGLVLQPAGDHGDAPPGDGFFKRVRATPLPAWATSSDCSRTASWSAPWTSPHRRHRQPLRNAVPHPLGRDSSRTGARRRQLLRLASPWHP